MFYDSKASKSETHESLETIGGCTEVGALSDTDNWEKKEKEGR